MKEILHRRPAHAILLSQLGGRRTDLVGGDERCDGTRTEPSGDRVWLRVAVQSAAPWLPPGWRRAVGRLIPLSELSLAALLFVAPEGRWRLVAPVVSAGMLSLFIAVLPRLSVATAGCGCWRRIESPALSTRYLVVRNVMLIGCCAASVLTYSSLSRQSRAVGLAAACILAPLLLEMPTILEVARFRPNSPERAST